MAIDFIKINKTAPQAGLLLQAINAQRSGYNLMKQAREMMTHMNDGSDFSPIATAFGYEVGKEQQLFDLVNGSIGSMEGIFQVSDAKTITEKVG